MILTNEHCDNCDAKMIYDPSEDTYDCKLCGHFYRKLNNNSCLQRSYIR